MHLVSEQFIARCTKAQLNTDVLFQVRSNFSQYISNFNISSVIPVYEGIHFEKYPVKVTFNRTAKPSGITKKSKLSLSNLIIIAKDNA